MTKRLQRAATGARTGALRPGSGANLDLDGGTVTLASNAGTLSKQAGMITTEALTTAAGATQALTITNTLCAAASIVHATINGGTSSAGLPTIEKIAPAAGSFVITVGNRHASAALNGTLKIGFVVIN